jgi:uncharacterized protein YndB with AHSA1/START domain
MSEFDDTVGLRVGIERSGDGLGLVHMDDLYETSVDGLWAALTDAVSLGQWVAGVEGDLRVAGAFTAAFTSGWEGVGRVDVCDAPHRLVVTLAPDQEDETVIEAKIYSGDGHTRLVLEERGIPLDEISAHAAGWQVHMEDLQAFIAGTVPSDWRGRWKELAPRYEEHVRSSL